MTSSLSNAERFSFVKRPLPIPADLRISWRTSLLLLMLGNSRAKRASLPKLHVLNCAIRSERARKELSRMLDGAPLTPNWQLRVEPALGRAIDFLVGQGLATWVYTAKRASLQLTTAGISASAALSTYDEVLKPERLVVGDFASRMTEAFVADLLAAKRILL